MVHRRFRGLNRREAAAVCALLVGYTVVLMIGRAQVDEGDPDWQRWVLAGATIAMALAAVGVLIRAGRRSKELERFVFSESTSLAFFATMLAALTYALLESLVEAPRLTAWSAWAFGMGGWGVISIAMSRSLR